MTSPDQTQTIALLHAEIERLHRLRREQDRVLAQGAKLALAALDPALASQQRATLADLGRWAREVQTLLHTHFVRKA